MDKDKQRELKADDKMMRKILVRECGDCETDEYAADMLELGEDGEYAAFAEQNQYPQDEEFAEDNPIPGKSRYFSTAEYTMIPTDDDSINCQGS